MIGKGFRSVVTSVADLARQVLTRSDESAYAYLRQRWLDATMSALRQARRDAGLSQSEVARRLGTTQSAIARLENDLEGRISLHGYADYLLACDRLPLNIVIRPASEVRSLVLTDDYVPFDASRLTGGCDD